MATVKQIAEMSGVSTATVSYALNGKGGISEGTKSRIFKVAKKLNYNLANDVSLLTQKTRSLKSLTFVSCLDFSAWGEPYFGQILQGCLDQCHSLDISLQIAELRSNTCVENDFPVAIRKRITDGLIVIGWPSSELVNLLAKQSIPTIFVDSKNVFDGFTHVRPDHAGGIIKATKYLHGLGHSKIGVIAGDMSFDCEIERLMAYQGAMNQLGLKWEEEWIVKQPEQDEKSGYAGFKELVTRQTGVTAVLCHGDFIARGAITAAKELGISIPRDYSIVGFDNQPWSANVDPSLTTVDVSLVELGQLAVNHFNTLLSNPDAKPQRITIEAKMVIRESVAALNRT